MKTPNNRLEFANTLRGLACVVVMISHYILTFEFIHGRYDGFSAVPHPIFPKWIKWPFLDILSYAVGGFGVALFFLISGLVIPMSVDAMSRGSLPRVAFFISRVFRIMPTYAVGAAISVVALVFGARYNGNATYVFDVNTYAMNVSLFRDWMGGLQFDGVVWTLEVESKFYIVVLLFWALLRKRSLVPLATIAILAILATPFVTGYPVTWNPPDNFVWYVKYLMFMGIGVAFNYHYRGSISTKELRLIAFTLMATFAAVCSLDGTALEVPGSYAAALLLFSWVYAYRRNWTGGPVLRFFARISFPLYAVHAPIGYVSLRILVGLGWSGLSALAVVTPCVIFIAWIMHFLIETPTQIAGKWLAGKLQQLGAWLRTDDGAPQEQ